MTMRSAHSRLLKSFNIIPQLLLLLAIFSLAATETPYEFVKEFSIGLQQISQDQHTIPGFTILGTSAPQLLRDRIVLTPPTPGNQRAGIWSDNANPYSEWAINLDFRASGGERPGGSFHLWYTARGGSAGSGTDSVYTSKPWDGLALVIDAYDSSKGGSIRAYLNDGQTDYSIHHNVPSLAFAHCDFSYRNKGTLSKIKITQTAQSFKVEADRAVCFETNQVRLPVGYHFGVSAATSDSPDSFELFNLLLSTPEHIDHAKRQQHHYEEKAKMMQERAQDGNKKDDTPGRKPHERDYKEYVPEVEEHEAAFYKTQEMQFSDLHDRIQALTHHLAALQSQIGMLYDKIDSLAYKYDEQRSEYRGTRIPREQVDRMDNRLEAVEKLTVQIGHAITSKDYSQNFESLQRTLEQHHSNLLYAVPDTVHSAMRGLRVWLGVFGFILVGAVVAYMVQKRRKASMPKKYL